MPYANIERAIGFPFQVQSNGTISLPIIEPIQARGKTPEQFKQAIVDAYTEGEDPIFYPKQLRIYVSMIQQRDYELREMLRRSTSREPLHTINRNPTRSKDLGLTINDEPEQAIRENGKTGPSDQDTIAQ